MSQIKVFADLVSPEASLLGLQMAAFLLCHHAGFLLYMCWREKVSSGISYSYKTPALLDKYLILCHCLILITSL